jgi:GTPase SAR1 family protein
MKSWVKELQVHAHENVQMVFVGNKIDMVEEDPS